MSKSPKKILFFTRRFWPQIGGVERHTLEVAKRLVERGHKVVVVAEATTDNLKFEIRNGKDIKGIKIYRIPAGKDSWWKKWIIWAWLWRNRKLIQQADLVHAHDVGFWYWPLFLLYPRKPFFITFHGWEGQFPIPFKNKMVRKISEKMARGNICVGDYLGKWYGTKADFVTYGGVEGKLKIKNQKSKTQTKNKKIIFIGRLEEDTGLPIYLQAFDFLNLDYRPLFLGDGSWREQAKKRGQVLGFVRNVRPYLGRSRFVFTSGYLSILEAMMAKRLVFAVWDNPLKEDSLKLAPFKKWIVVEPTPKKLAKKVRYFTDHPQEEKKLVEAGYNWVKKQSWEKVVGLYVKLWER